MDLPIISYYFLRQFVLLRALQNYFILKTILHTHMHVSFYEINNLQNAAKTYQIMYILYLHN